MEHFRVTVPEKCFCLFLRKPYQTPRGKAEWATGGEAKIVQAASEVGQPTVLRYDYPRVSREGKVSKRMED